MINRYFLALAIFACSYATTIVANDSSLRSDLLQIYRGEKERLEQKFIKEFQDKLPDVLNLDDLTQKYPDECKSYFYMLSLFLHCKQNHGYHLTKANDRLPLYLMQEIILPFMLCKKYIEILVYPPIGIDNLILSISCYNHTKYALYATYARHVLIAVYFDSRKQDEENISEAKRQALVNSGDEEPRNRAIRLYLQARMAYELLEQDIYAVHTWAGFLRDAKDACSPTSSEPSKVFLTMLENEFIKLHEYYLERNKEINYVSPTARMVLEKFGYIND